MAEFLAFIFVTAVCIAASAFIFMELSETKSRLFATTSYGALSVVAGAIGYPVGGLGGAILFAIGALVYLPGGLTLVFWLGVLALFPVIERWDFFKPIVLILLAVIAFLVIVAVVVIFTWDVRI